MGCSTAMTSCRCLSPASTKSNLLAHAATWEQGDWNGDLLFTSGDFVAAFTSGGYELGARGAVSAVQEPAGLDLLLVGALAVLGLRRRP